MTATTMVCLRRDMPEDGMAGLFHRVRSEYLEMPGLRLGPAQAARLFAMDPGLSESILNALVADGFLAKSRDGAYVRASAV